MKFVKNTIAALAVASTAIVPMATSASAHDRGFNHRHGGHGFSCGKRDRNCDGIRDFRIKKKKSRNRNGDIAGAAILGIIGGALIGQALSNQNQPRPQPRYVQPQPRYNSNAFPPAPRRVQQPRVIEYGGSLEPWSQGWYNYCENRYRSFNPQKGTFRGYDGHDHFCVAK